MNGDIVNNNFKKTYHFLLNLLLIILGFLILSLMSKKSVFLFMLCLKSKLEFDMLFCVSIVLLMSDSVFDE